MAWRLFSDRGRPVHLGPYPLERLVRRTALDLGGLPPWQPVQIRADMDGLVGAMAEHQAMMDAIRDGFVNKARAAIPEERQARSDHLKAFGYFSDASMVGCGPVPDAARLAEPVINPGVTALSKALQTRQTKTLAAGIDLIMADLKESMTAPVGSIAEHGSVLVFLYEYPRDPRPDEPGGAILQGAQAARACLRATETAVVIANYIRLLGWEAKAHTGTASDLDLDQVTVASGLGCVSAEGPVVPWLGRRFGVAAVSTTLDLAHDAPLAPMADQPRAEIAGWRWQLGLHSVKSARTQDPFRERDFAAGPHPFESLRRVDKPTTYIDEANVPRVPKRTDMFARAQFGDMGPALQKKATGGFYVRKAAPSAAQRRALGAFVLLQDGAPASDRVSPDPQTHAEMIKAASYFLGVDAVGISRCPAWAWYSHDATGTEIDPPHDQAISMIIDQGFETMEGASGDDWISVAQSMRAYLRFSLLGGVIAVLIRRMGYAAKAHTVLDGEVLQPPLLLLSGLGEVSRIGEVILNPFLGPRLKSGVVTTDMPLAHDQPIDFGLQRFCEGCNKCARECPSGAITAGPKRMFNGYEIWKSDSQKCATYRITTEGGAMCGRCMKTCPWNLEGLFAEAPFRWVAMNVPQAAPVIARLDDAAGRGGLNPVKKWWWDLELQENGAYRPTDKPVNARDLQPRLKIRAEDQTLAVYPAPLAPHPWPYPYAMDREAGIEAFQAMVTADVYRKRQSAGDDSVVHRRPDFTDAPVLQLVVAKAERLSDTVMLYRLAHPDGADLPAWEAGAHLDIVVAPEYLRQYSMCGDPADRSRYEIAVLREDAGRGGSQLMHRIFAEGRRVFVSKPINHFPLVEEASHTLLMGGGIGVTPMIAMAHRLHAQGRPFALHYSVRSRADAAFVDALTAAPWAAQVAIHVSDEGSRADLPAIIRYVDGAHIYTCGPDAYMQAVMEAASHAGFPEDARHLEFFAVPELPDRENHPFTLRLSDGRDVSVSEDETATDALARAGIHIDVKCADGICGVCQCTVRSGTVDHRDFVLSNAQRKTRMILCQSRAAEPGGVLEIEL
ncbi:2Fe-2S iron-sulfur cluster-binding protein [Cognatishimia sp. F0-27]|uniref:2Fe-2S iron-sulfur cluster-binding protein n=1 Tax=Cognatishimia sp. F0-27 TaxID=2816855 RepID=UPI001D0C63CC|nr:2Fe-2S iron-sulfur cluster-binding protein [Cognatishimia sp. F0-27]MCC1495016.1 2Fe-2S iron-sulfur cluster binding domain-containing protein [Cognatishimia sp. F0-27]